MKRVYIRRKNEVTGHVFVSNKSVAHDKVKMLPFIGFVTAGLITEEEWAKNEQLIADKFELTIEESFIDGRTKKTKHMKRFCWKDIFELKALDVFVPMGYCSICNTFGMEIEISKCGSMVRYRIGENGSISNWKELYFTKSGKAYFNTKKRRYYLSEFIKIN